MGLRAVSTTPRLRWAGLGALLGGALWAVHALLLARRPEGCVADACHEVLAPNARPTEDLAWLYLLAVALLAGAAGLLAGVEHGRGRTPARVAAALLTAGAAVMAIGLVVNAALVGDSPLWWLHDSDSLGRFLPVAGGLAAGVGALRGGRLPSWAGVTLVATALLSLGFNAQDDRVLLPLPLGLAWAATGAVLLLRAREEAPAAR